MLRARPLRVSGSLACVAAAELSAKDQELAKEQQMGARLADQLREARAEALRALQHGALGCVGRDANPARPLLLC